MDVEVKLPNTSPEGNHVDPIEYGKLLHAVETMVEQNKIMAEGLKHANDDVQFLKESQKRMTEDVRSLTEHVKHLNGTDKKLERVGLRLDDDKEHRKDQIWLRSQRRKAEARSGMVYKAKAALLASLALAVIGWVLKTLWAARDTLPTG